MQIIKVKSQKSKVKIFISLGVLLLLSFLYPIPYTLYPTLAQAPSSCNSGTLPRADGLVTSPSISGKFGTTGGCIVDPKTAFVPFRIPTYADLSSKYYDQSKLPKNTLAGSLPGSFSQDGIYKSNGLVTINGSPTGDGTELIFVEGKLNIVSNLVYHTSDVNGGLVLIVRDDVVIAPTVTQVDAVIISSGTIYTAGENCLKNSITTGQLVINGSLISLSPDKTMQFCRQVGDNFEPAEVINAQPKYLVLLRSLMSDTLQKWSEIP